MAQGRFVRIATRRVGKGGGPTIHQTHSERSLVLPQHAAALKASSNASCSLSFLHLTRPCLLYSDLSSPTHTSTVLTLSPLPSATPFHFSPFLQHASPRRPRFPRLRRCRSDRIWSVSAVLPTTTPSPSACVQARALCPSTRLGAGSARRVEKAFNAGHPRISDAPSLA